jgi:hypothetical protein
VSVFDTYARSTGPRPEVVGRCHGCGNEIIDLFAGPTECPCWNDPPPEFDIEPPPRMDDMP